jgi:hypothetical protein
MGRWWIISKTPSNAFSYSAGNFLGLGEKMFLRQKSKRNLDDVTSMELLHLIELTRYEIGIICETARISKNDLDLENLLEKEAEKMPKI